MGCHCGGLHWMRPQVGPPFSRRCEPCLAIGAAAAHPALLACLTRMRPTALDPHLSTSLPPPCRSPTVRSQQHAGVTSAARCTLCAVARSGSSALQWVGLGWRARSPVACAYEQTRARPRHHPRIVLSRTSSSPWPAHLTLLPGWFGRKQLAMYMCNEERIYDITGERGGK